MKGTKRAKERSSDAESAPRYISASGVAERWGVSRMTVSRAATKEGWSRIYLGSGPNGTVRYLMSEVESFEESRTVKGGNI